MVLIALLKVAKDAVAHIFGSSHEKDFLNEFFDSWKIQNAQLFE